MAKTSPWVALRVGWALALGALTSACSPAVPATPSYATNVRPIFESHCTRCHGDGPDGGMLNTARQPTGPDAGPLTSDPAATAICYLNQYDDTNCAPVGADCHRGAQYCGTTLGSTLSMRLHGTILPMPPPPAPRLDDWELLVVDNWIASGAGP